jgi:hypothetical protein
MADEAVEIHFPGQIKVFIPESGRELGGGREPKSIVDGKINGEPTSLVRKEPSDLDLPKEWREDPVGYVVHMSEVFTDAGLPAVEMGYSEKKGKKDAVWMPNLTADGSRLYDWSQFDESEHRALDELDEKFLEIQNDRVQSRQVRDLTDRMIEVACKNKLQLPPDDAYSLHVRPNGSWGVEIIDLTAARERPDLPEEELFSINSGAIDTSNANLHELNKLLLTKKFTPR